MSKRLSVTTRALVVHHETDRAYLCSSDGGDPSRTHGWLPKKAVEVLEEQAPFILVRGTSELFMRKRLFGFEPATLKGEWTEEQQAAWRSMMAAASRKRLMGTNPQRGRCEYGNEYA